MKKYLDPFLPLRLGIPFGVDDLDRLRFLLEPCDEPREERDDSEEDLPRRPPRVRLLERDLELPDDDREEECDEPDE